MTFDPAPARRGLDHIDMSFARWSEFLDAHPSRPMATSAVSAAQNLLANSYLIDLVRWIRSVDDGVLLGARATGRSHDFAVR